MNSSQLDRAHRVSLGFGLGYILNRNTVFTFDTAAGTSYASAARTEDANGNLLQNGIANGHLLSAHVAVQRNVWRRVFVSASFLNIWYDQRQHVEAYPDQFGSLSVVQDAFFLFRRRPISSRHDSRIWASVGDGPPPFWLSTCLLTITPSPRRFTPSCCVTHSVAGRQTRDSICPVASCYGGNLPHRRARHLADA